MNPNDVGIGAYTATDRQYSIMSGRLKGFNWEGKSTTRKSLKYDNKGRAGVVD